MAEEPKPYFDLEKQQKAIEWLKEKCGEIKCECCEAENWQLMPELITPINFRGGVVIGGAVTPSIMIICTNCGNTKFFNAILAGVLPPQQPKQESQPEKKEDANGN